MAPPVVIESICEFCSGADRCLPNLAFVAIIFARFLAPKLNKTLVWLTLVKYKIECHFTLEHQIYKVRLEKRSVGIKSPRLRSDTATVKADVMHMTGF